MPLFPGDLPDYPDRYADLLITVESMGGRGAAALVSVVFEDGDHRMETPKTKAIVPVEPWEIESISSRLVIKQAVQSSRDLENPAAELGSRLFDAVFTGRAVNLYATVVDQTSRRGRSGLCVRFQADRYLSELPWELVFDRTLYKDFVALAGRTSLVRATSQEVPWIELLEERPRVLIATADPDGRIEAEEDVRILEGFGDKVSITVLRNPDRPTLLAAVAQGGYDVLHIAGSAAVDADGRQQLLLPGAENDGLASLSDHDLYVAVVRGRPRAVVLAVCRSDLLANKLAGEVPVSIGIRGDVSVAACLAFLRGFYGTIVQGGPVPAAIAAGRDQIVFQQPGDPSWAAFTAYTATLGPLLTLGSSSWGSSEFAPAPPVMASADPVEELTRRRLAVAERNLAALDQQWGPVGDAVPEFVKQQRRELEEAVATERQALENSSPGEGS